MAHFFKSFFKKTATTPIFYFVVAFFVLNSSYIAYMMWQIFSIYPKVLDLETFGYSAETIHRIFNSYGEKGMILYKKFQMADIIYPFSVFLFSGTLLSRTFKNQGSWIYLLPLFAMGADYCENYFLWSFRETHPMIDESRVIISSVCSVTKHSLILLMLFLGAKKMILKGNI